MKSVSAGLKTHIAQEVTTIATCWKITRTDGEQFFFTDLDVDLEFEGDLYLSSIGYSRTAIGNTADLSVDNLDIEGILDNDIITEQDLRAGAFDYSEVEIFVVNYEDLNQGRIRLRRGWMGEVILSEQGIYRSELRGLMQALSITTGELYSPECRADLGDERCKIPLNPDVVARLTEYSVGDYIRVVLDELVSEQEQYGNRIFRCTVAGETDTDPVVYDDVVGNTTVDGTAEFICEQAWTRHAVITTVVDRKTFRISIEDERGLTGWFNGGLAIFETGDNALRNTEISSWVLDTEPPDPDDGGNGVITLWLNTPYPINVGDKLRIYPGCDKRRATCISRFNNIVNMRAEPFVPGTDFLTSYPSAK